MMKLYTFFDTTMEFVTNHPPAQKEFDRIYGYFASTQGQTTIHCSIEKSDNSFHIKAKSKRYSLEYTTEILHPDIYLSLFSPVIYETKDYFLIHGGSLSGIIISAPCGFGKTTLTRELLKDGFGFLSDELAPVNLKTGLVHPYPRGMGVLNDEKKTIIEIQKDRISLPCKPKFVIFLTLEKVDDGQTLEIAFNGVDIGLFKNIEGIKEIVPLYDRLFPMLRFTLEKEAQVIQKIQEVCDKNNMPIIYTLKGRTHAPDFNAIPKLKEIPQKEGIFLLSQNILNAYKSALLEETFNGSRPKMIFELAGLMQETRFFTLTVGKLSEMVNLIHHIHKKFS